VLANEKASLFAQQSENLPDDFVPPCLKCLKLSNVDSTTETSNAIIENIATITNGISNPSPEEFVAISDENSRLKDLLETGMLKSLKGHQAFCDVLKKSILHKNPRKEGLGFKIKLNVAGTYWTAEQYPQTSWVLAKSKTLEPTLLSHMTALFLLMMSLMTQTTNSSNNRMVRFLLGMLGLTIGQVHPRSKSG
jgi:hypothetical protein